MDEIKKLQEMTDRVLAEASKKKGKKSKKDDGKPKVQPAGYTYAEALDFSAPLGSSNLYKTQGRVLWGPQTGVGPWTDDTPKSQLFQSNKVMSSWDKLAEKVKK